MMKIYPSFQKFCGKKILDIPELLSESRESSTVKGYYRSYKKWDDWLKKNVVVIEQGSSRKPLIVSIYHLPV